MKLNCFLLSLLIQQVFNKLSLQDIHDVVYTIGESMRGQAILKSSILNPVFGYLLESTGALSNLRFYGPGLKITTERNCRNYSSDKSSVELIQRIIELFPSENGFLSHVEQSKSSYKLKSKQCQNESIQLLANIFLLILKGQGNDSFSKNHCGKKFLRFAPNDTNYDTIIQLMAIHAFVINSFDDKEYLKNYLNIILDNIYDFPVQIYQLNCDILNEVLIIQQEFKSFPYSELNQPPSADYAPIFVRSLKHFDASKTFQDFTEILLLNICNCLFYNSENGSYSTENLNPFSALARFYKTYNKPFTITDNIRRAWLKVVQGLENFSDQDDSKYNLHKILYLNDKSNELECGIINLMNVLIRICEIDHFNFWMDFDGYNIEKKLKQLFKIISPIFPGQSLFVTANSEDFNLFKSFGRLDFKANFNLTFIHSNGDQIKYKVILGNNFTSMRVISHNRKNVYDGVNLDIDPDETSLPIILFKNFIEISQNRSHFIDQTSNLYGPYFSGYIETDEQKKNLLINIGDEILKHFKDLSVPLDFDRLELLKSMANNILNSIDLKNPEIKLLMMPVLFCYAKLQDKDIIECWIHSFSIDRANIYELWKEKVINLNCESMKISFFQMSPTKIVKVFKVLMKCNKMKNLYISGINFDNRFIISQKLGQLVNLEILDLSNNNLGLEGAKEISKALKNLNKLAELYLSGNFIRSEGIFYISKAQINLSNLTVLDLSNNHIDFEGAKYIAEILENTKSLKSLNLTGNSLSPEGSIDILEALCYLKEITSLKLSHNFFITANQATCFGKKLIKLTGLTTLKLSHNLFKEQGCGKNISKALIKLINLEDFDLSHNFFKGEGDGKYIAVILKELTNLKSLDLSSNSFVNSNELIFIAFALSNLSNLIQINISNNNFGDRLSLHFFEILKSLPKIKSIDFSNNGISPEKMKAIIKEFTEQKSPIPRNSFKNNHQVPQKNCNSIKN